MKKISKNGAGFSIIEILLIVIVVGLLGFIGWYVYSQNNKANNSLKNTDSASKTKPIPQQNSEAQTAKPIDETQNWKSYTRYGITLKYPTDWGLKANDNTQSTSTTLTSPEFTDDGTKGQQITVDEAQFTPSGLTVDNFKSKHLDAGPNPYSDYKVLTVNGKKAIQYYQGDSRTTVFFLANGKIVTLVLDTFPNRAAASATYDKVLGTITLN